MRVSRRGEPSKPLCGLKMPMLHSFVMTLGGRSQVTCRRCLRMLAAREATDADR